MGFFLQLLWKHPGLNSSSVSVWLKIVVEAKTVGQTIFMWPSFWVTESQQVVSINTPQTPPGSQTLTRETNKQEELSAGKHAAPLLALPIWTSEAQWRQILHYFTTLAIFLITFCFYSQHFNSYLYFVLMHWKGVNDYYFTSCQILSTLTEQDMEETTSWICNKKPTYTLWSCLFWFNASSGTETL